MIAKLTKCTTHSTINLHLTKNNIFTNNCLYIRKKKDNYMQIKTFLKPILY